MVIIDPKLLCLIEQSHTPSEAQGVASFQPTDQQRTQLAEVGRAILKDCRPLPGTCMLMSALFASRLRKATDAPAHVIAGALSVEGVGIFGYRDPAHERPRRFDASDDSWDGHAWVMFGPLLADVSLFRTARSPQAHSALRLHVASRFSERAALLIDNYQHIHELGFDYSPWQVLTDEEIEGLANGARVVFGTD